MSMATLQISRQWIGMPIDRYRPWDVILDGAVVGTVDSEQTVKFSVESGRHTLRIRGGWHVSPERCFEAEDDGIVQFWCYPALLWPVFLASLIKHDLSITLKQD